MTTQILENDLNFDIMLFVPECYIMKDRLYYNPYAEDRFQEPEESEQFYGSLPTKKRKRY
jgi:hypothetical protein